MASLLYHLYCYYSQLAPFYFQFRTDQRAPLRNKMEKVIQLAKWDDVSYYAQRLQAEKTHRQLHKLCKDEEDLLNQPMAVVLTGYENKDGDRLVSVYDDTLEGVCGEDERLRRREMKRKRKERRAARRKERKERKHRPKRKKAIEAKEQREKEEKEKKEREKEEKNPKPPQDDEFVFECVETIRVFSKIASLASLPSVLLADPLAFSTFTSVYSFFQSSLPALFAKMNKFALEILAARAEDRERAAASVEELRDVLVWRVGQFQKNLSTPKPQKKLALLLLFDKLKRMNIGTSLASLPSGMARLGWVLTRQPMFFPVIQSLCDSENASLSSNVANLSQNYINFSFTAYDFGVLFLRDVTTKLCQNFDKSLTKHGKHSVPSPNQALNFFLNAVSTLRHTDAQYYNVLSRFQTLRQEYLRAHADLNRKEIETARGFAENLFWQLVRQREGLVRWGQQQTTLLLLAHSYLRLHCSGLACSQNEV